MIDVPSTQLGIGSFGSKTVSSSVLPILLWMVIIIASVTSIWMIWMWLRGRAQVKQEWEELDELLSRAELSREEDAFVRRHLRRGKVKKPMSLLRSERQYLSFFKKRTERAGQHSEFLMQAIQRKLYGSSEDK